MNFTAHAQVAVIGGGIIGSAIAYYAAKSGYQVTVIERGELASGTSSRCDGCILSIDKDPGYDSQMSLISQQLVRQLKAELTYPFEYQSPGSVLVCETEEEMAAAQMWVDRQKQAGLPMRLLDRQDIRQESPFLADDLLGGVECSTDSLVNPYNVTYAMFEGAKTYGARLMQKTEVTGIDKDLTTGNFRIQTNQGAITADKVVNAAGVWAPGIGKMVGLDIPIVPRKGHLLVGSRQASVGHRNVMEFGYLISKFGGKRNVDAETENYGVALVYEPMESQNFLFGSSRQFLGYDTKVDMNVIRCIARRVTRFYPKIGDFNVLRTYTGLRPWTEDHLPIVSRVEKIPGFFIAAGHEGDGISLAAVTGKLMSDLINESNDPIVSAEPLRLERFDR